MFEGDIMTRSGQPGKARGSSIQRSKTTPAKQKRSASKPNLQRTETGLRGLEKAQQPELDIRQARLLGSLPSQYQGKTTPIATTSANREVRDSRAIKTRLDFQMSQTRRPEAAIDNFFHKPGVKKMKDVAKAFNTPLDKFVAVLRKEGILPRKMKTNDSGLSGIASTALAKPEVSSKVLARVLKQDSKGPFRVLCNVMAYSKDELQRMLPHAKPKCRAVIRELTNDSNGIEAKPIKLPPIAGRRNSVIL